MKKPMQRLEEFKAQCRDLEFKELMQIVGKELAESWIQNEKDSIRIQELESFIKKASLK